MRIGLSYVLDVSPRDWAEKFAIDPGGVETSVQQHLDAAITRALGDLGLAHGVCRLSRTGTPTVVEFVDDDAGYQEWLATHPAGYVVNVARSRSTVDARIHHAGCRTISGESRAGKGWTGAYIKVCGDDLAVLDRWASSELGASVTACGTCGPRSEANETAEPLTPGTSLSPNIVDDRSELRGPAGTPAVVEAWATDYIRFERRPDWQQHLRQQIRDRCRELEPSAEQIFHAEYFGAKHPNADVENLVLYYIDSFRLPGRNGIRFEYGSAAPLPPSGTRYPFCYRYALVPRSGSFRHWQRQRMHASFGWTDLGALGAEKQAATVWQALVNGSADVAGAPITDGAKFAVRVELRPPFGRTPVWGGLVKGIIDGVVCAFQAHTDAAVLPEVVSRLAKDIPMRPNGIQTSLTGTQRAVLGVVPRLVYPYRNGVKWDPADHLCVAGELLPAQPVDDRWAIRGDVVELVAKQ